MTNETVSACIVDFSSKSRTASTNDDRAAVQGRFDVIATLPS
jgi:hypothetical protein